MSDTPFAVCDDRAPAITENADAGNDIVIGFAAIGFLPGTRSEERPFYSTNRS
jgi:hypothetical protein